MADNFRCHMTKRQTPRMDRGDETRTIIWCVPRSVSTALTKCLSFVEDIQVWFEPITYCRMAAVTVKQQLGLDLPLEYKGNEEVYRRMVDHFRNTDQSDIDYPECLSYTSICRSLERSTSRHVLVKDMAFAVPPGEYKLIPKGFKHIFLIRHPLRVYTSIRKSTIDQLSAMGLLTGDAANEENFDVAVGFPHGNPGNLLHKDVYDIWKHVTEELGCESIVIDADDLLTNPAEMLPKICRAAGLPYDESLLKWDGSPDVTKTWKFPDNDLIAKLGYFYDKAISSSGFLPSSKMPSRDSASPDVIRCVDKVMKYYNEMFEARMKV